MTAFSDDPDRKIVPRWRTLRETLRRKELAPIRVKKAERPSDPAQLSRQLSDWNENKTLSFAADLVSTAIVSRKPSVAHDAARFILSNAAPELNLVRALAQYVLGNELPIASRVPLVGSSLDAADYARVRVLRSRVRHDPRDSLSWVDLGLAYTTLGQLNAAERALHMALVLNPNDRFVLRSAARFYLHSGNPEQANWILMKSPRLQTDPWILAAHLVLSSITMKPLRLGKVAKQVVEEASAAPFHLSELASALATLELDGGNVRKARRFLTSSLVDPTENAVAQAAWLIRRGDLEPSLLLKEMSQSAEAAAWKARSSAKWLPAFETGWQWLQDQPFSSRPAVFTSYIAAVCLQNHDLALAAASAGLKSNKSDSTLLNNAAVSSAMLGNVADAQTYFHRIERDSSNSASEIVWLATKGLIAYRGGHPDDGRGLYQQAIALASEKGDLKRHALAYLYFAREECRSASPSSESVRRSALSIASELKDAELLPLAGVIEKIESSGRVFGEHT